MDTRMFNFFEQAVHKVSQSVDPNYDDQVELVHELFQSPYAEGALIKALSDFLNNLEWSVTDSVDRLDSDLSIGWSNAVASFIDELSRNGFDTSQMDGNSIAAQTKEYYMGKLREKIRRFFSDLMNDIKNTDAVGAVLDEALHDVVEGY